jgi:hypothetical protein
MLLYRENFEFPCYKLKERKGRHRNNICTFHVASKSYNIFLIFSTNFMCKKASPIHADMKNDDTCMYNPLLQNGSSITCKNMGMLVFFVVEKSPF